MMQNSYFLVLASIEPVIVDGAECGLHKSQDQGRLNNAPSYFLVLVGIQLVVVAVTEYWLR
jgi:hypothetical protein